jgi:hypothetical protein
MNCKDYQNLIIKFLSEEQVDNKLQDTIQEHLLNCDNCTKFAEEIMLLLDFYTNKAFEEIKETNAPDPEKIWNKVRAEIDPYKNRNKSFSKALLMILTVLITSSTLTAILTANFIKSRDSSEPTFVEKTLSYIGLIETPHQERMRRIKEQKVLIEYWNQRVQTRRHQWNQKLREAFERNLNEIDQAVAEYEKLLQENPYDEISSEMLDSAVREKLELLQEFAQL